MIRPPRTFNFVIRHQIAHGWLVFGTCSTFVLLEVFAEGTGKNKLCFLRYSPAWAFVEVEFCMRDSMICSFEFGANYFVFAWSGFFTVGSVGGPCAWLYHQIPEIEMNYLFKK